MATDRISRRQALWAGAAAVAAGASAGPAQTDSAGAQPYEPVIGVSTLQFRRYTNAALAEELARNGIRVVQLFLTQTDSRYWKYNERSDVSDLTEPRCQAIAAAYRAAGVSIHSMGVYANLIHPDPAECKANLAYFDAMMKIGGAMGVKMFVSEAGHYHSPDKPEPAVALHFQEEVWKTMVSVGKELARLAESHQATVLLEPFYRGFLASAKRTRVFIEEVGSPRIRALLDPANLLEVNDLEEMFTQLAPYIDCLHAKDRKLHVDRGVPAGQGDVDYEKFVALAAKHAPRTPLILEYVGPEDYLQSLAHLRKALDRRPGKAR